MSNWNEFRSQHKGKGYSQQQLSAMYKSQISKKITPKKNKKVISPLSSKGGNGDKRDYVSNNFQLITPLQYLKLNEIKNVCSNPHSLAIDAPITGILKNRYYLFLGGGSEDEYERIWLLEDNDKINVKFWISDDKTKTIKTNVNHLSTVLKDNGYPIDFAGTFIGTKRIKILPNIDALYNVSLEGQVLQTDGKSSDIEIRKNRKVCGIVHNEKLKKFLDKR